MEKPRSHGEPGKPRQEGLDELTVAFSTVSLKVVSALMQGEELRTRERILGSVQGVLSVLLRTMQYPRDVGLIEQLTDLNSRITAHLDSIVLNANANDPALQKLRELAVQRITWATLVRPGDHKFTDAKLDKLQVGANPVGASLPLPKKASLATGANRLARWLIGDLTKWANSVFHIGRNGVMDSSTYDEARQTLLLSGVPEKQHAQFLSILGHVERNPFSKRTVTKWGGILADYVLFVGPKQFTELKLLLRDEALWDDESLRSHKRSKLQRFFNPALKHLAG